MSAIGWATLLLAWVTLSVGLALMIGPCLKKNDEYYKSLREEK